jgi:hypothetical protein
MHTGLKERKAGIEVQERNRKGTVQDRQWKDTWKIEEL